VPQLDSGRAVHQAVQCFLADLGAGVGQQVGDGFESSVAATASATPGNFRLAVPGVVVLAAAA
jgi:hypothetical protein